MPSITLDNVKNLNGDTSATSHTYSNFVVANQSDRLLLVVVGYGNSNPGTKAVTFGGAALTEKVFGQSTGESRCSIWYKVAPAVSTGDVVVTNSNASRVAITIIALYNVDQTTIFRDNQSNNGASGTSDSLTMTSVSGDWLVDGLHVRHTSDPGALVPGSGTETTEMQLSVVYRSSARYDTASGSTIAAGWTWTACSGASSGWSHAAVTVIPKSDAQTFSYTGAGGLSTGGGAADFKLIKAYRASGSIAMSGVAGLKKVVNFTSALDGMIILAWDAVIGATGYKVYYDTNSGTPYTGTGSLQGNSPIDVGNVTQFALHGLTLNQTYYFAVTAYNAVGEGAYSSELSDLIVTGIVSMSGHATQKLVHNFAATGGIDLSGTATKKLIKAFIGSGEVLTDGAATTSKVTSGVVQSYTATGQATIGGAAGIRRTKTVVGAGQILLSGAALIRKAKSFSGSGSVQLSSAAIEKLIKSFSASGGVVTDGTATTSKIAGAVTQSYVGTGALTFGGAAVLARIRAFIASGGVFSSNGSALIKRVRSYSGAGIVNIPGAATFKLIKSFVPTGGVITSGEASSFIQGPSHGIYSYTGSGGLVTGGAAALARIRSFLNSSGGVITGGAADFVHILHLFSAGGGVDISGQASVFAVHRGAGSGGLDFSGDATTSLIPALPGQFFHTGTGGMIISGSSPSWVLKDYFGSGGVTISGAALLVFKRGKTLGLLREELRLRLGDRASTVWTDTELNAYIVEGYDQLVRLTLALWRREIINGGAGEVQGEALYDLPEDFFNMDRVTWDHKRIDPVYRSEIEYASPGYETIEGTVDGYLMEEDGLNQIRLWRVPAETGTKTILEFYCIPAPITSDDSAFEIPFRYIKYIRHYATWKALERNGPGQDLKLAEHYHQRWMAGVARMIDRRISMNAKRTARFGEPVRKGTTPPPRPKYPWNYGEES